ncbi:Ferric/cupric reductase transmembrane component B [Pseudocercospora fuligena]|uniref:Ferric/cupric reductase transmembrane component B n=1 Tax=Pseudocercospora fuligena TaxID=685502 RepID=A0A8H6R8N6_9PEZI|nr:Ferric/cupric reductase transmembrane component B [Pseudocercospora fuligena]
MHPSHYLHARLHLHAGPGVPFASDAGHIMAPRDPDPLPNAIPLPTPGHGPVTDFGTLLNMSANASPFSHGLEGVNQYANYLFANVLVISFMGLLAGTLVYRWIKMGHAHMRHLFTMGRESDQRYFMYNHSQLWPWIKRHILYAPLWKNRHNREWKLNNSVSVGTLPSRFHTVLLLVYLASNTAYCLAVDWSKPKPSVVAELRGRTGVLAAINIIPTILFALRNNPAIRLLRVPYDTFNLLHRWCARMMVLESILHTIFWAINAYEAGGSKQIGVSLDTSLSYRWGMVATCAFTFIVIAATGPLRHAAYETFIMSHQLLVIVGIAGVYVHLDAANLPMLPYVQLSIAFYAVEVFLRFFKAAWYNYSRQKGITRVTVEWLPAEACRVTFDLSRPWKWRPGCHVHVWIPRFGLLSTHPFSIAWAENRPRNPPMEIEMEKLPPTFGNTFATHQHRPSLATGLQNRASLARIQTHQSRKSATLTEMANIAEETHKAPATNITLPREADVTSVSLIIRARNGMTRNLYDKLSKNDKQPIITWGAIEGPYGGHDPMSSYGTVILFAGGVGITHCIGYIHHLMLQYQAGTCSTRKILLVWSVPNTEALEWVRKWMDQILRMEFRRDVLRIQLYITKPRHRGEVVSSTGSVQMFPGRCVPATIIEKELPERIGSVGVTVCGPGAFSDSVRQACRNVVQEASVDFIEEAFTY